MRILHIIGTLDPAAGGPTEWVRAQMEYAPAGATGEAVTLDDPSAPFLSEFPFRIHALGPIHSTFGYTSKLVPWLIANRHRFDGVVVNGLWQYIGLAAWRALRGHVPYVVFTHGMLDPYFKRLSWMKHLKKVLYWYPAEYWVLRGAYRVLFTTAVESELAKQSFGLHQWTPKIIPIGAVGPELDTTAQSRRAFYSLCPAVQGKRFVLFLGRIHRKKGCDLLIEAFGKVAASDPELHLVMAGPDQQGWQEDLQARAGALGVADRVHWPGMVQGEAKWGAFFASEVFALPSHQENFGVAVAEALACGRPVLLSDQINIAGEIDDDACGFVAQDTLDGTVRLLQRWIATPAEERERMSARAIATFHARYDMKENARALIRMFEEATSHEKSPAL